MRQLHVVEDIFFSSSRLLLPISICSVVVPSFLQEVLPFLELIVSIEARKFSVSLRAVSFS